MDNKGNEHDWKVDLIAALAERQDAKGNWVNSTPGFMEGDANLVTAYGLMALARVMAKA
jgi:squalene-hopene/tetraprenyl-beta-curcumene cyclase